VDKEIFGSNIELLLKGKFLYIIVAHCAQLVHITTNSKRNHEISSIQIPNFIQVRCARRQ
jgi:hypothetical protein